MKRSNNIYQWLPSIGIVLFFGLYYFASTLYPGGSQANSQTVGFDWVHNYWCNLTNTKALNGDLNLARPYALLAMVILCCSLMLFFTAFAQRFSQYRWSKLMIRIGGILSMSFAVLVFTKFHDVMISLSSFFGFFALIGIIWEIHQSDLKLLKLAGIIVVLIIILNNIMYYSRLWIVSLPLIQKITFAFTLIWTIGLNYKLTLKT